jgi:toxin secretion/phage lysis holin
MDGNKIVLFIKSIGTAVGTVWSFIVGAMGWSFPTLILLMVADFLSGLSAGSANEGLSSARGRKGFVKKVHVLIIIGAVYLLEKSVLGTQHLGDGVTIAYIVIEFISLVENAGRLGVPLGPVKNIIEILKSKGEGK